MSEADTSFPDAGRPDRVWVGWPRPRRWTRPDPARRPPTGERLAVGCAVWSLFLAASLSPAYVEVGFGGVAEPSVLRPVPGWVALLFGWLPWSLVPWSANLWLACGWVAYLRGEGRAAARLGAAAVVAGLTAWAVVGGEFCDSLLLGYYLWQASLAAFAAVAYRQWRRQLASRPGERAAAEPGSALSGGDS